MAAVRPVGRDHSLCCAQLHGRLANPDWPFNRFQRHLVLHHLLNELQDEQGILPVLFQRLVEGRPNGRVLTFIWTVPMPIR